MPSTLTAHAKLVESLEQRVREPADLRADAALSARSKGAASAAVARMTSKDVEVPEGTVWSAVGKP